MSQNITRRSITKGIAWSAPAVAVATAAPAHAASPTTCDLSGIPGGTVDGTLTRYGHRFDHVQYVGLDGFLGTPSFWIQWVDRKSDPATLNAITAAGCDPTKVVWIDNSREKFTVDVQTIRAAGSTHPKHFRPITLNSSDFNGTTDKYLDPRGNGGADSRPFAIGKADYAWRIGVPSYKALYDNTPRHRAYITLHPGDGLEGGSRLKHQLKLDGVIQTFENQGDQIF